MRISAANGTGLDNLFTEIEKILNENTKVIEVTIPYSKGTLSNYVFDNAEILEKEYRDEGVYLKARVSREMDMKIASALKEE